MLNKKKVFLRQQRNVNVQFASRGISGLQMNNTTEVLSYGENGQRGVACATCGTLY